jgi:DUF971 family protein
MKYYPEKLELVNERTLRIVWNDQKESSYLIAELRNQCPCATCREKRNTPPDDNPLQVISVAEAQPLRLTGARPVGNYAYSFEFSDGHDTGIYTIEFLRELSP